MKDSTQAAFGLPYSPVRQIPPGYTTFCISGHTGVDIPTQTAPQDIVEQTAKLFSNLTETLKIHGLGLNDVVQATVFLTDITNHYRVVNDAFDTHFDNPKPARSVVGVVALPPVANVPLLIEIDAIVAVQDS
jgi:2-iminobutanoate/2-iminopropanoate deaminase